MKIELTRNIILDLMPIYLAGEASEDTKTLVEEYLKTDPELAKLSQHATKTSLSQVPVPIAKEAEMEAYVKATQRMLYRMLVRAVLIIAGVLGVIVFFMYFVLGMR